MLANLWRACPLALAVLGTSTSRAADRLELTATPIPLHLVDPTLDRVGQLRYRGGLALRANDERFGGLSGVLVRPDGDSLVAISDMGDWFELELTYAETGHLSGAKSMASGRLHDPQGAPLGEKREADAEGFARLRDGSVLISFEMGHRVWRYPGDSALHARPEVYEFPEDLNGAPKNLGIEAMILLDDDRMLLLSEGLRGGHGRLRGWVGGPGDWSPLTYWRHGGPRPTAATRLPGGDVLVLERGFSQKQGPEIRLRRIVSRDIQPAAALDGEVIAELRPLLNVDNFEGLDSRVVDGEVLLYLLSDDNFNERQRTLLLMFALEGSTTAP